MTTFVHDSPRSSVAGWFRRAEAWLDGKGMGAWIAAMVLAFILVWPVGLALLAYMIWSNKMTCSSRKSACRMTNTSRSSGNSAFDAYRNETLRRLEEEQQNFEAFLQRLRDARDKAEFDQFMDERARTAASSRHDPESDDNGDTSRTY